MKIFKKKNLKFYYLLIINNKMGQGKIYKSTYEPKSLHIPSIEEAIESIYNNTTYFLSLLWSYI